MQFSVSVKRGVVVSTQVIFKNNNTVGTMYYVLCAYRHWLEGHLEKHCFMYHTNYQWFTNKYFLLLYSICGKFA